jgi:hypothetical protein
MFRGRCLRRRRLLELAIVVVVGVFLVRDGASAHQHARPEPRPARRLARWLVQRKKKKNEQTKKENYSKRQAIKKENISIK